MTGRSHLLIGLAATVLACADHALPWRLDVIVAGALGSLLPDIDTPRSMLGARLSWVARPLNAVFGHRTVTHSAVLLAVCVWLARHEGVLAGAWGALLLGYGTHIAADMVSGGCQALYPVSRSRIAVWPHVRTGGAGEMALLVPILAGLLGVAYVVASGGVHHGGMRHRFGTAAFGNVV